jgi:maltooligosyltrehalose trehalohydrolase
MLHLIAESDLNDVRVITPRDQGGLGHHAQWTDDFHHSLRVALTGERHGYYADFDGVEHLASSYRRGYVYAGQYSAHRGRRYGSDSTGLPGERFVVYAQNHDQVGNRLAGDRLTAQLTPAQLRLAAAAVLLSPFLPMLFMGEEYGETAPFPYFISHGDEALVKAVRAGRKREFAAVAGGTPPDPQAIDTFLSAKLDWSLRDRATGKNQLSFVRELLRLRRTLPSLRDMSAEARDVEVIDDRGISLVRRVRGEQSRLVLNFSGEPLAVPDADSWDRALLDTGGTWDEVDPWGARLYVSDTAGAPEA